MSLLLCYYCHKPFGTWYEVDEVNEKGEKIKKINTSPCRKVVNNKKEAEYMHEICYIAYIKGQEETQ